MIRDFDKEDPPHMTRAERRKLARMDKKLREKLRQRNRETFWSPNPPEKP